MLVIALAIFLECKSSVLFNQNRVGENKVNFKIHKFKTMENHKITRVGRIIRNLGLDELPQLVNIIKGEMAFVGPRPLTQFDIDRLKWNSTEFNKRWNVKPGITGKAQLSKICSAEHSIQQDLWYVEHKSILVDLAIMANSLLVPFIGKRKNS